jgi:hypothetical protein
LKAQEKQIEIIAESELTASDKSKIWTLTWIEVEIGRKWWEGKKNNGGIKKIPLNPKIPKLAFRN